MSADMERAVEAMRKVRKLDCVNADEYFRKVLLAALGECLKAGY